MSTMNTMNIYPMHADAADRRHWVVRVLRVFGYIDAVAGVLLGIFYGYSMGAMFIMQITGLPATSAVIIGIVVGVLLGLAVGLMIGLPVWALSMLIDDIHALRLYASAYIVHWQKHEQ